MIKLDVQEYCHGCTSFKPITVWDEESTPFIGVTKLKDIRIVCKHYTKCHYAVSSAKLGRPIETTIISEEASFDDSDTM